MSSEKTIVVTIFGYKKTVQKFSVNLFDKIELRDDEPSDDVDGNGESDKIAYSGAIAYCEAINSLELKDGTWVRAEIVCDNAQYKIADLIPVTFDRILNMDDRSIQKVLRELDSFDLGKALKGADEAIQDKVFRNMSKRTAQMLKEDMEYMNPVRKTDAIEAQNKILSIIRHLSDAGEIVIYDEGELVL